MARARRARERREGIVVLLLMLVLLMASGTAAFALQSTQYEQRSASAVSEANWARGLAECTTMAGIAFAEDPSNRDPMAPRPGLAVQWQRNGSAPPVYTQKYAIPTPPPPTTTPPVPGSPNRVDSVMVIDSPAAPAIGLVTVPGTLASFLPANERSSTSASYPMFANYDSQTLDVPGLRFYRAHWLQERLTVSPANIAGVGTVGVQRTRTVVTGFAEINVWGDRTDLSGVRGLHELDAISRGYIDTIP